MSTRIRAYADSAVIGDLRIDTLRVATVIDRGVATFDTLTVRSNFADVTGAGSLPVTDSAAAARADLEIDATVNSLDPVRRWIGIDPVGLGTGNVHIAVTGPVDSVHIVGSATASALLLGRSRLIGLDASLNGRLVDGLRLGNASGSLELDRLDVGGFEVRISSIDADWDGNEIGIEGDATIDDRRDVAFNLRLDPRRDAARATIERFDFRADNDRWALAHAPTISWQEGLSVDSLALRAGDQTIVVAGLLDPADRSDLSARVQNFRIGTVADLLGYDALDGEVTASLDLQGSAADPRITGGVDARLSWRNGQSSSVVATVAYDTLQLDLDSSIRTDRGGALTVAGTLPIDLR
jgi:hypothetical protein